MPLFIPLSAIWKGKEEKKERKNTGVGKGKGREKGGIGMRRGEDVITNKEG